MNDLDINFKDATKCKSKPTKILTDTKVIFIIRPLDLFMNTGEGCIECCGDCRQHQAGRFTTTSCIRRVDLLIGNKTRELQLVWHYQATTATVQTHFVLCKPSRLGSRYTVHRCQHSDYICMCIFVSSILILHAHTIHT